MKKNKQYIVRAHYISVKQEYVNDELNKLIQQNDVIEFEITPLGEQGCYVSVIVTVKYERIGVE